MKKLVDAHPWPRCKTNRDIKKKNSLHTGDAEKASLKFIAAQRLAINFRGDVSASDSADSILLFK